MKASDYIVEYLIAQGVTDVFGYPGGMVTHLMDSFAKYSDSIAAHVTYHEQAAAFAACGYAQTSGKPGVAYATSGPGATNLITGICNAYFDSIPTVFITGQVNTNEAKGAFGVRQRGFQETDIVSIIRPVTKYAAYVENTDSLMECLSTAFNMATSGRMGPVLLDIPMNVMRASIDAEVPKVLCRPKRKKAVDPGIQMNVEKHLNACKAPCLLVGHGVKITRNETRIRKIAQKLGIPVVTSMTAFDTVADISHGFIGAYGTRAANFIIAKSDLILSVGSRLDIRQVGANRSAFAPNAKILRFDVDKGELEYKVHADELQFCMDMESTLDVLEACDSTSDFSRWIQVCNTISDLLQGIDRSDVGDTIAQISEHIPENTVITTDVGQNQVWVPQSFRLKKGQRVLFSGGHGAMGYSLPSAIGAYYGCGKKPVVCFTGDGGLQMNIQELQYLAREQLPVTIFVLNNSSLGMIRHFQEMYFDGRFFQTKPEGGYSSPSFDQIAKAYGIPGYSLHSEDLSDLDKFLPIEGPVLIEIRMEQDTYVFPKLEFGKPNQDQEPLLDRVLYERIMAL